MVLVELFVALFIVGCVTLYLFKFTFHKATLYANKFSGPKPLPLVGNAFEFNGPNELLSIFDKFSKEYNGITRIFLGCDVFLLVTDYDFVEFLLSNNFLIDKAISYKTFSKWLGTGLLTGSGSKWRKHRKIITPSFHFQILESFVPIFESNSEILVNSLKKELGKESFDVYNYITLAALDTVCETAMGTKINAQLDSDSSYVKAVRGMGKLIIDRAFSAIEMTDFLYPFTKNYRLEKKYLKVMHGFTEDVIRKRKQQLKISTKTIIAEADDVGVKRKLSFLDVLLKSSLIDGQALSDKELREEVDTFMFEGHDTTSSAMSFALWCLANNPEIQELALQEQKNIFGDEINPEVTLAKLQEMKYMELVIKETLRLYPSVPFYGRKCEKDIKYKNDIIPKGVNFIIYAFGIQRDPRYFPNPDKFDPSRFETSTNQPFAFVPFSAGPRNCIGQKFAMLEIKSLVSSVLRSFVLLPATLNPEVKVSAQTILKSENGINIRIKARTN